MILSKKELMNMNLHECQIFHTQVQTINILRVATGWIYTLTMPISQHNNTATSTFIPERNYYENNR